MIVRQAVKRSRDKNKQKLDETKKRVDNIREQNKACESKIDEKKREIQSLKDAFVNIACGTPIDKDHLSQLLNKPDDGPSGSGTSSKTAKKK